MALESFPKWSLDGLLDEVAAVNQGMPDRSLAFILGAGASAASGIPTASRLAERWLQEIHERTCLDHTEFETWIRQGGSGIAGLREREQAAEFYPQIYEHRFGDDPEAGYAELEDLMEGRSPSLGYSMLAEILQKTRHKIVVTTNFDNLVSDALAMHGHKAPLIVAHESLTSFARPLLRRPLVAKIHRDLLLHPKNDKRAVDTLEAGWKEALRILFQTYQPVVVGYGGNDGSLMGLLQGLEPDQIAGRIWWCQQRGAPLSKPVLRLLHTHRGVVVESPPFDEFMLRLAARLVEGLDLSDVSQRIERKGRVGAERFRRHLENLAVELRQRLPSEELDAERLVRNEAHWWTWLLRAVAKGDHARKEDLLRRGMEKVPWSGRLAVERAEVLLSSGPGREAEAEALYESALTLSPTDATLVRMHAAHLQARGLLDEAGIRYAQACALDPADDENIRKYAVFLETASAKSPEDRHKEADELFRRAIELDPDESRHWHNYGYFLQTRGQYGEAEKNFQRALHLNPTDPLTVRAYAGFLVDVRQAPDLAEAVFTKARNSDHGNADIRGYFADFVQRVRGDYAQAEALFLEAIRLEPHKPQWKAGYADFLFLRRHDTESAAKRYEEALRADPLSAEATANLACLLLGQNNATSRTRAGELARHAVELCRPRARQACAEAMTYLALLDVLEGRDPMPQFAQLKWLLAGGYPRGIWDFGPLYGAVLPGLDWQWRGFFEALGHAVLDALSGAEMGRYDWWTALAPVDPYTTGVQQRHRQARGHASISPQRSATSVSSD